MMKAKYTSPRNSTDSSQNPSLKQAEEALQAEHNKLLSLMEAMEYTVTIQDTEYNIIYQNEPSRIASGGDHLGEKCYRAYEGRETVCERCPVEKAFRDGKSHTTERRTTTVGMVTFWENTANPVRDAKGEITSCLEVARDVTERKRIERQSHEREIAEARAQELSISHQRLINAQESLRKDIASQLHGTVQSRLILLEHKIAELEARARSKWMTKELADVRQRLEELQNEQIRSISHRLFPSILRLGIATGLESLIDEYSAKLSVDLRVSKKLKDREQANRRLIPDNVKLALYRIAEEALTNISKHTPATGKIVVKLSLSDGRILRLTVKDDGPGYNTTGSATGIGLPLIADYAAAAGGSCTIESIPGKGTRVTAELPLAGLETGQ